MRGRTYPVLANEADTWNLGLLRRSGALPGAGVQVLYDNDVFAVAPGVTVISEACLRRQA